jgi:hypothetical protein
MADDATTALVTGGEIDDAPKPISLADELAATREKLSEERKPKLFELPGYGPKLQVKYKVVDYDSVNEIGDKVGEQIRSEQIDDAVLAGLSDTLVAACVGFYTEVDGEVVPLEEAEGLGEGPIRWGDARLWSLLRLEAAEGETLRVRAAIRGILGNDKMLVVEHGQDVTRWMERARRQVDADF